jgi:hypothetical protein
MMGKLSIRLHTNHSTSSSIPRHHPLDLHFVADEDSERLGGIRGWWMWRYQDVISMRLREKFKGGRIRSGALMGVGNVLREYQRVGGCELSDVTAPKKRVGAGGGSKGLSR